MMHFWFQQYVVVIFFMCKDLISFKLVSYYFIQLIPVTCLPTFGHKVERGFLNFVALRYIYKCLHMSFVILDILIYDQLLYILFLYANISYDYIVVTCKNIYMKALELFICGSGVACYYFLIYLRLFCLYVHLHYVLFYVINH